MYDALSRETYLAAAVHSATPQRLHLMLVEGAIRFCRQGLHHWSSEDEAAAAQAFDRAQEIVVEMLSVLNPEANAEVAQRMAALYVYLLRRLSAASLAGDVQGIGECLSLLDLERITWSELCERSAVAPRESQPDELAQEPATAPSARPLPPPAHFIRHSAADSIPHERADFSA